MFMTLVAIISEQNAYYAYYNHQIQVSDSPEDALAQRTQFILEYADKLHDLIWNNLTQLTARDCVAFDLVPYTVWNVMSQKYVAMIDEIRALQ